ncbi:MAG: pyruvate oxidase [Lactobacillales bacterium]|jgi:pyruvate oxidase|nr:pyruvate oxidase [Lactobacillales bacterium]
MEKKIPASEAMVKVLESWGVDHIYGIPGGSFNSTMDALYAEQGKIRYIQVRHEEVGSLAAVTDAKLTGKVGVVFGSAGPGATHLIQGLYDAQMDHVPVVALLGQVGTELMNTYGFQELNENPMFADVSVYNRTVMTAEQLPLVVDNAIKEAYQHNGVAVVTIPVNLGTVEIPDTFISSANTYRTSMLMPDEKDIEDALELLKTAERPYLYIGRGLLGAEDVIKEFSEHFSMPIGASALAKGIVPDAYENLMGQAGRVATKPGVEAVRLADYILFAGSDFPFAMAFFNPNAKFVHVNIDKSTFGRRHKVDVAILGDAKETLRQMIAKGEKRPADKWFTANQENKKNWDAWMHSFDEATQSPLRIEPIYAQVNEMAEENAIFISDVGNVTVDSIRHLNMNGKQKFATSGWFATMGNAVPGGIAAKLSYPDNQVFTLSGDGGFAMMCQGIITQSQYHLPIINVILTNRSLGFIEAEQEDTHQTKFGVSLVDVDFAKVAEGMGAKAYTATNLEELKFAFEEARKVTDQPIVIDCKVEDYRPLPVEQLKIDPAIFSAEEIKEFAEKYQVHDMPALTELLK